MSWVMMLIICCAEFRQARSALLWRFFVAYRSQQHNKLTLMTKRKGLKDQRRWVITILHFYALDPTTALGMTRHWINFPVTRETQLNVFFRPVRLGSEWKGMAIRSYDPSVLQFSSRTTSTFNTLFPFSPRHMANHSILLHGIWIIFHKNPGYDDDNGPQRPIVSCISNSLVLASRLSNCYYICFTSPLW